jgi:hypothetical protein
VVQELTKNHKILNTSIDRLSTGGSTALYDAIATANFKLSRETGKKVIIYLTDGKDNQSSHSLSEIRKMTPSEGIMIMGIGLGSVEKSSLKRLKRATKGIVEFTNNSSNLSGLFAHLSSYYKKFAQDNEKFGSLIVSSLPDNKPVFVGDREIGETPYISGKLKPNQYDLKVEFGKGDWDCQFEVKGGYRTIIDGRESEVGSHLVLISKPKGSSVFLNGAYAGITALQGSYDPNENSDWHRTALEDSKQHQLRKVPFGEYEVKVNGMPGFDFGAGMNLSFKIPVSDEHTVLYLDIIKQKAYDQNGKTYAPTEESVCTPEEMIDGDCF